LEALGFTRDEDRSTREKSVWTHPADPGQPIRVYVGLKEDAATVKIRRAEQIAGLATTGDGSDTIKDRARIRRQADARKRVAEIAAHDRALAPYQQRADQRVAEKKKRETDRQRSQLLDRWQDTREQLARTQQAGHDTRRAVEAVNDARRALDRFDANEIMGDL
jgi:cell fate (sporulation/competence/biofilm development) regulator YlbF (YheA/YmcA/DUF963 family)